MALAGSEEKEQGGKTRLRDADFEGILEVVILT